MEDAYRLSMGDGRRAEPDDDAQTPEAARLVGGPLAGPGLNRNHRSSRAADRARDLVHAADMAEGQNSRLERLLRAQADELAQAYERMHRLTALCDLAEWAAIAESQPTRPSVSTDDIRRALSDPTS